MIVNAIYQCRAVATPHRGGPTRSTYEPIHVGTHVAEATHEKTTQHAAWQLWRELIPWHRVDYVDVEHVEWRDRDGRWHRQRLTGHRFQGADLRDLCPPGSPYAAGSP